MGLTCTVSPIAGEHCDAYPGCMGDAVTIRPVTRADIGPLAAVLARAFTDDPPFVWALPNSADRTRRVQRFFRTLLRVEALPRRAVDVACDGPVILGGALWFPPGAWPSPTVRQVRALGGYARAFGRRLGHAQALVQGGMRIHPREPHWYLYALGVDPPHHGNGVGGALLRSRLQKCDSAHQPAYLESSKLANVPLYEHFGFRATSTLALPQDAPVITAMWRPPREPTDR